MKLTTKLLFASLLALAGSAFAKAQESDFEGKIIKLGAAATTLQTGQWYVLYNAATDAYVLEGSGNTLGITTTSPDGADAASAAGYLVQLEETDKDGIYYLKSGLGNYYCNVTTSKNNGTSATLATKYDYTVASFGTAGHWNLKSHNLYFLQSSGGNLIGAGSRGSEGGDRDWAFRTVSFSDLSDLTGTAYVRYVLSSTHLVRLTNRRNSGINLADNGTNTEGAGKNTNSLSQVWILAKAGEGYTLRNGNTGRYLNDDDNFRTPSVLKNTIYIQFSPNNGTNGAYINLSENNAFSGNVCLNLGSDATTLFKWTCSGDTGSDWSIAIADNFSLDEVEAHLLEQTGFSEPVSGKYYRIRNVGTNQYVNENYASYTVNCENKDADRLSQYWTLIQQANGRWFLQNLCTQRNIAQQNGSLSTQYRTSTAKTNVSFDLQRTNDATSLTYYILDNNTIGLHCDAGSNVVGWSYSATNSVWGFEEVTLDEAFIEEGRARLAEYTDLQQHLSAYRTALSALFQDNACTVLKDDIQALTDEELAANADFAALNADMKEMVLKVKNNTWQSFTSSEGYTREAFEKFFRVRDDFYVYSHYQKMTSNQYAGMSNAFGKLSGPTGIVGGAGDIIYIYVDEEPSSDCTLQAEVVVDSESPGDHATGSVTNLHAGLNTVLLSSASTLYIFYQLNNPERFLADYPAAKVHIEGGQLQGYFDYTRGMTNQDWTLLCEKLLDKSRILNLKCDRLVFAMLKDLVLSGTGPKDEMEGLMRVWNNFVEMEENLMGFKADLEGRYRNVWNAFSVNHGYMYASTYGTYYSDGTVPVIMNYNTITTSGGAIWGPSHEIGHNHQSCFNIVGATEVSNNLFSNANVFMHGVSTTRGTTVTKTLDDFARGAGWFGMDIWEQTRFYFQLYLYFHAQGHNPEFYPTLFKLLRQDPIQKRSGTYDATLVKDGGEVVGGYLSYGRQDYLHMAKKMCDAAKLDLSELFEVNGMFVPYEKFYVNDYGDYWVTTTQQDIDEAKAYMHRYPKAPSICFIDDRIKPSAAIFDGPFEGKPRGENRVDYDANEVKIGYADVGQWSDFTDDYQTDGYYYTTTTSQGVTTYNINGSGAIGFKVYDNDGNLVFLSNKKKFSMPSYVLSKLTEGFKIVACDGNGYEVLVPYGPAMYRGELTAYYEGDATPHTLYYYGTGTAGKSLMNPLPANSVAYVKPGQSAKKLPTEDLLANVGVVDAEGKAQSLVIDGDKPFYVPTEFTAESVTFSKKGEGYQALRLPFDTWAGEGVVTDEGTVESAAETYVAGQAVLFQGDVNISEKGRTINSGTFAETESGYIYNAAGDGSFLYSEHISPFTYVWENNTGIAPMHGDRTPDAQSGAIYNVAGQRVSQPAKGLYIVRGKKIVLK